MSVGTELSIGPTIRHDGSKPIAWVASLQIRRISPRRLGRSSTGGRRWKIAARTWRIVASRSSTARLIRSVIRSSVGQHRGGLQGQPGGEEPLDHVVVEVAGDPLALVDQRHGGGVDAQLGMLDGDARRRRQRDGQLLVGIGERPAAAPSRSGTGCRTPFVGVPSAERDRHAEERAHRRVVRREAVAVRVAGEVRQAQRARARRSAARGCRGPRADDRSRRARPRRCRW